MSKNSVIAGLVLCTVLLGGGCSDGSDRRPQQPQYLPIADPLVAKAPEDGQIAPLTVAFPLAERLSVDDAETGFRYDDFGSLAGGVRTPYVDAPAAVLSGEGQAGSSFCFLFGTTELFDVARMAELYVDKAGYVDPVARSIDEAIASGFLLQADAQRILDAAVLQWERL